MDLKNLIWEQEGRVAIVTFSRPKALNALNEETFNELARVIDRVESDDTVGALVLTGAGEKAFVAGADIGELQALETSMAFVAKARRGQNLFARLEDLSKPVIAAINGFALGGGLELALACDIRFAADSARMGLPEINLGLIPGYGGTQRLARLIGEGQAKMLIFSGKPVTATRALELGIVENVLPAGELLAEAKKLAAELAEKAPVALALAKRAIHDGLATDMGTGCSLEAHCFSVAGGTEDCKEGMKAFFEKRPAQFKGR
ncbi:enoyl-CoA hydratase/isomerase family protein [Heliophilum fasciatum]|uniref:short-chain-enoyl-CoA hydratase n=1 Tax=Heliophilum fasciatum TaxID=35700 RepID=A0A4R2RRF2_9FIRM|nr:enoyl-CoA hydratase-related protein [Heliophilum fasciatum]MCW2278780.1 enoyl-CoA hydratase [Heliophilum fasciatum]TCP62451.1 enoyl-CoA hydratase [Heliophilum fasciatum]